MATDSEHTAKNDAPAECYGCFWELRPGPWHTCVIPSGSEGTSNG